MLCTLAVPPDWFFEIKQILLVRNAFLGQNISFVDLSLRVNVNRLLCRMSREVF